MSPGSLRPGVEGETPLAVRLTTPRASPSPNDPLRSSSHVTSSRSGADARLQEFGSLLAHLVRLAGDTQTRGLIRVRSRARRYLCGESGSGVGLVSAPAGRDALKTDIVRSSFARS